MEGRLRGQDPHVDWLADDNLCGVSRGSLFVDPFELLLDGGYLGVNFLFFLGCFGQFGFSGGFLLGGDRREGLGFLRQYLGRSLLFFLCFLQFVLCHRDR